MIHVKSLKDVFPGDLLLTNGDDFKEVIFDAIELIYNGNTYILNLVNDENGMFSYDYTYLLEFEKSINKFYILIRYDSETSFILKNIQLLEKEDIYNQKYLHRITGYKI